MTAMIILSEEHGEARRVASLETENRHLRALLLASRKVDAELRYGARRDRVEADRLRAEAELRDSRYRRDIAELRSNADRQALLMQELAHRVKNTLAMVQAIGTQTLRTAPSLDAARAALDARLIALAQAHDVLLQGASAQDPRSTVPLRRIVATAVALHGSEPDRFAVSGPEIALAARSGLTLALLLHELGTNAAKYGALSTPAGHVTIDWAVEERAVEEETAGTEPGAARFRFRWEEAGGPPVSPPRRAGFGTRLIERSLVRGFGGRVDLAYPASGLVLSFEAPFAMLAA
ncbi:HWE histidine kinase domain-containing protein [Methylobacterium radiodurans]|nr:sensor histidine kinase [Methylobacterium radiodurans]